MDRKMGGVSAFNLLLGFPPPTPKVEAEAEPEESLLLPIVDEVDIQGNRIWRVSLGDIDFDISFWRVTERPGLPPLPNCYAARVWVATPEYRTLKPLIMYHSLLDRRQVTRTSVLVEMIFQANFSVNFRPFAQSVSSLGLYCVGITEANQYAYGWINQAVGAAKFLNEAGIDKGKIQYLWACALDAHGPIVTNVTGDLRVKLRKAQEMADGKAQGN
jgi:hypothetical protein